MFEGAPELRAIAPLIVTGPSPQLVGPCTLVSNGTQVVAISSSELLRAAGEPLAIALTLDCKKTIPVTSWSLSRVSHMGLIDLRKSFPVGPALDVEPLDIASVCATIDTRGAPSALVSMVQTPQGVILRRVIPVHVDAIGGGAMTDDIITRLATPDAATDVDVAVDGSALLTWMPADPVLGRPPEVVLVALGCAYRANTFKPREHRAIAELYGLDDLARVLPWQGPAKEESNELGQVAGEIKNDSTQPLSLVDIKFDPERG